MWVIVYFDLPTETKKDKRAYQEFRKFLQKDGFRMMQFSVYIRHCNSRENADVHKTRVRRNIPEKGNVIIFEITDAQFGRMEFYEGYKRTRTKETPQQIELF